MNDLQTLTKLLGILPQQKRLDTKTLKAYRIDQPNSIITSLPASPKLPLIY